MGRIDPQTRDFIINDNYREWTKEYGPSLKTSLAELARKKKIIVRLDSVSRNGSITLTEPTSIPSPIPAEAATPLVPAEAAPPLGPAEAAPPPISYGATRSPGSSEAAHPPAPADDLSLTSLFCLRPSGVWVPAGQISADAILSLSVEKANPSPSAPTANNSGIEKELAFLNDVSLYGPTYLLTRVIQETGLLDILRAFFPLEYPELITLIHFLIIDNRSLTRCHFYAEIHDTYANPSAVSPRRIGKMLATISISQIHRFYKRWSARVEENGYLAFDGSQFATYSENNEYEYGRPKYFKSVKPLKRICSGVLYGQQSGLPVYPLIYNGILNDAASLINAAPNLDFTRTKKLSLALSHGFFTKQSSNCLRSHGPKIPFIIGLPPTASSRRALIEDCEHIYMNQKYAKKTPSGYIYGTTRRIKFAHGLELTAYIFMDQRKEFEFHDEIIDDFSRFTKRREIIREPISLKMISQNI